LHWLGFCDPGDREQPMWSPRVAASDWFGDGESSEGRPSTAHSSSTYVTARSSSTAQHAPAPLGAGASAALPVVPPAIEVLPSLLADLSSDDANVTADAAMHLCLLLDSVAGEEAAALGEALRASGERGLPRLVALLDDPTREARVSQSCLLLLANLAAPDIDPSGRIAADLKALDALRTMLPLVSSEHVLTVAYALGAIRNNATTVNEVQLMADSGTIALLQSLANGARSDEDPTGRLRQYAAGCLINVRQLVESERRQQQEQQQA